jgi:hypothetical protein
MKDDPLAPGFFQMASVRVRGSEDNGGVEFQLDHAKFESLCAAFEYVLSEHATKKHSVYPGEEPAFIFRGECGKFQTTRPSIARVSGLSRADVLMAFSAGFFWQYLRLSRNG